MPATIEDVALEAGVSTATVSRALRGLPNVAPSTRALIIHVAEQLEYHVSPHLSRHLLGRKNIGIVMPLVDQWFFSKVASIAEIQLMTAGCDVARYSIYSLNSQRRILKHLTSSKMVDGLILSTLALSDEDTEMLQGAAIPVVTIETETSIFPSISIDNVAAAELGTRYLINLGHRRIALIEGLDDDPLLYSIPEQRRRGYVQALEKHEIEYRPEFEVAGNYSYAGGAEAMKQLFSLPRPPTAVFALSDEMAIGALKTIRDTNLRVPEDISVIGFDDNDVAEYVGLTTIRQPVAEYGELAAGLILQMLSRSEGDTTESVRRPMTLVLRATSGPCAEGR
ncbi:MAG: LacI family transcriptional regulator [Caldilineaceae bacterium]|nr:LacI family transcriptional regulator [Caldilineaceae bacterium]